MECEHRWHLERTRITYILYVQRKRLSVNTVLSFCLGFRTVLGPSALAFLRSNCQGVADLETCRGTCHGETINTKASDSTSQRRASCTASSLPPPPIWRSLALPPPIRRTETPSGEWMGGIATHSLNWPGLPIDCTRVSWNSRGCFRYWTFPIQRALKSAVSYAPPEGCR